MNNVVSDPSLVLPEIPTNFEAMAGTSRTDFCKALFHLMSGTKVTGINVDPSAYDYDAITKQLASLNERLTKVEKRTFRLVIGVGGVSNTFVDITFDDIGTTHYMVLTEITRSTGADLNPITIIVVEASKKTNGCRIRFDGPGASCVINCLIVAYETW